MNRHLLDPVSNSSPRFRILGMMGHWLGLCSRIANAIAAVAIVLLMLIASVDVFQRLVTGRSISGILGIAEVLLASAVFLSMARTYRAGGHVSTGVVVDKLPPRVGLGMELTGQLLATVVIGWMAYATTDQAWSSSRVGEVRYGIVEIPIWPGRIALAIGMWLLFGEMIRSLLLQIDRLRATSVRADRPRSHY